MAPQSPPTGAPAQSVQVFDVVISGAGPTGLTLANLLGQSGLSVLLLERNVSTVLEPRAVSIDDESLRSMQSIGLLEEVMARVVPGYGLRYLMPSRETFLTVSPAARPYGHPRRNAFRQPVFEAQLRAALGRFVNVDPRFGAELVDFVDHNERVIVDVCDQNGSYQIHGRYLVGCDGASSLVRKKLGFVLDGATPPDRWIVVDLENSPAERDTVVFCDPRRPCIALPGPNETRRFEFKLFPHEQDDDVLADDVIDKLLNDHGAAKQSKVIRKTVYSFHARVASRWSKGRVHIAGDAAHLTPPFAGQGMNSGIRDAHNLAWKLETVLRGKMGEHLLDSYETERRDHVSQMIQLAIDTGKIMSPPNIVAAFVVQTALRLAGLVPALKTYFGEMKYKPKPKFRAGFLIPDADPLIGSLLPQPMAGAAPDRREALLDDIIPPGFALLGVGVAPVDLAEATKDAVWTRLAPVRVAIDSPQHQAGNGVTVLHTGGALDAARGSVLLVRPDRYVMASFKPGQEQRVTRALAQLLGEPTAPTHASTHAQTLEIANSGV